MVRKAQAEKRVADFLSTNRLTKQGQVNQKSEMQSRASVQIVMTAKKEIELVQKHDRFPVVEPANQTKVIATKNNTNGRISGGT